MTTQKAEKQAAIEFAECQLCGEPMPKGEEMFNYHGYSGPCPKPPKPKKKTSAIDAAYKFLAKLKRDRLGKSPKISPAVMAEFAEEYTLQQLEAQKSQVITEFIKRVESNVANKFGYKFWRDAMHHTAKEMTAPEVCECGHENELHFLTRKGECVECDGACTGYSRAGGGG